MNFTYACVTRFNNKTLQENIEYRERNEMKGCCYGTPVLLQENIPIGGLVYVFEMNNETNKIVGLGLIRNHNHAKKKYIIYSEGNYNRFNYQSNYRLERFELKEYDNNLLEKMEIILFKGYTHMKRGHGIQLITKKKYQELKITKNELLKKIREMFIKKYVNNN